MIFFRNNPKAGNIKFLKNLVDWQEFALAHRASNSENAPVRPNLH